MKIVLIILGASVVSFLVACLFGRFVDVGKGE